MIPYILAAVGGYLIGDSLKGKQFAEGGMAKGGGYMAGGGMMANGIKVGDKVKLKNIRNWKGWGFENSTVSNIGKTLIKIKSSQGHTMYVKLNEIEKM